MILATKLLLLAVVSPQETLRDPSLAGRQDYVVSPLCPPALDDLMSSSCLRASSIPVLGTLYPLTQNLFVAPTGYVGIGTTSPLSELHVNGTQTNAGDIEFDDNNDGLVFSSAAPFFQQPDPMITMFDEGFSNPDRMVLGHSVSFPDYGLEYEDAGDRFVFQRAPASPVLTLGMIDAEATLHAPGGPVTVRLDSADDTLDGRVSVHDAGGAERILLDGEGVLSMSDGVDETLRIDANDQGGTLRVGSSSSSGPRIRLRANDTSLGPEIAMYEPDGSQMFALVGPNLVLANSGGTPTIVLNRQTGDKNGVVATESHGQRLLYAVESPEVWFEDFGSARLSAGRARIELDPVFLETVTVDEDHPLKVFITMTAESEPIWVEKHTDHFVVHEARTGRSDAGFDWRVVAKRRGREETRLESFELAPSPTSSQR